MTTISNKLALITKEKNGKVELRNEKTCLRSCKTRKDKTGLLSYRSKQVLAATIGSIILSRQLITKALIRLYTGCTPLLFEYVINKLCQESASSSDSLECTEKNLCKSALL